MNNEILKEAKRLHALGFSLLPLYPKQKRPKENAWTSGPKKTWDDFKSSFAPGDNLGVRLGEASKIGENYLACIDVDVKDPAFKDEALKKLKELIGEKIFPVVLSGSGNGSRHLYCVTESTFKMRTAAKLKNKYEIVLYSSGRQMVLSPSIHPSGNPYKWARPLVAAKDLPLVNPEDFPDLVGKKEVSNVTGNSLDGINDGDFSFTLCEANLDGVHPKIRAMIETGEGVTDRSSSLLPCCAALYKAKKSQDEILSLLTDKKYFLGGVAYEHAQTSDRGRAAFWLYRYTLKKVIDEQSAKALFEVPIEPPKELSFDEYVEQQEHFDRVVDWRDGLDQTEKGAYRGTLRNVVEIIQHDPRLTPELIKRDLFALRDFYSVAAPWGGVAGEAITDDDVSKMRLWFARNYGVEPNNAVLESAIVNIATQNQFDPIADWIRALPPWDGVDRLDTWLKKYFNGEGPDEYLAQVFRKWLCAMVLRIIQPGAKFDWMPIFEGGQGVGKSSFGRLLVGDKYFLDWLPDLTNKDAALSLQGIWAVEMGELASFRKNELEAVKAYVTRTVDKFRPPHGRKNIEVPRRCVFFGTTNKETYLRDDTGNRRFKPLKVGKLNFNQLKKDRLQLFAEALFLLDSGFETEETLDLDGEARVYEHKTQAEKMVLDDSDLMFERLKIWIQKIEKNFPNEVKKLDVIYMENLFEKGGGFPVPPPLEIWKYETRNTMLAGKALKLVGYKKDKIDNIRCWVRESTT